MNTIDKLEIILDRLSRCPFNLVRVELEMFYNTLSADSHLSTILMDIIKSNDTILGAKASTLIGDIMSSAYNDLSYANSASLRAAVGYQLCQSLLGEPNPIKCSKNVIAVGAFYAAHQGMSGQIAPKVAIETFSDIFLHPLVSYLSGAVELRHRILMLTSRYRQRSEWFTDKDEIDAMLKEGGEVEKRLKKDFLRYLFDNGVDFSVEAEAPSGHGEVDVLAVVPEIGPLPIEVKVYDGGSRNTTYITGGLAQTLDYARKFNSGEAYYIIYNVAENELLSLPGTAAGPHIFSIQIQGATIYSTAINLRITLPSSEVKSIKPKNVSLPKS